MTAPAQLAGWDVDLLRATVGRRAGTPDRLTGWRVRLEAVGRRLGVAECWSGPAGTVAAEAVVELATVTARASAALSGSHESLLILTREAAVAQEQAARALAVAVAAGLVWDEHGRVGGLPAAPVSSMAPDQLGEVLARRVAAERAAAAANALADDAAAAGARALRAAETAGEPLAGVRVPVGAALTFAALAARWAPPGPVPVPAVPAVDPPAAASWWAALTPAEQLAAVHGHPAAVGALDGLPAWARDQANRLVLTDALRRLPEGSARHATAAAVAGRLAALAEAGGPGQLLQLDLAGDRVAVAVGDLDTADAVAVLVPGILTTPADDLDAVLGDALAVATAAGPGLAVAAVAWLGYRTPRLGPSMATPRLARRGGADLDRALDGLAAARTTTGRRTPRTTVVAHSYGTVVTGEAVQAPGPIAADALVLLGSPGLTGGAAEDLEAGEVHGAWSVADPVSWLQWFGDTPMDPSFGDAPLPTELTQGHVDYLDPDRPTLAAIGQVVAGTRAPG